MYFTEWLSQQSYRQDLVGELADQMQRRQWPTTSNLQALRVRLSLESASKLAFSTLEQAFAEWQLSKNLPAVNVFPTRALALN